MWRKSLVYSTNNDLLHDCDFFDMSKDVRWMLPRDCTYFHGRGYPVTGFDVGFKLGEAIASSASLTTVDLGGCGLGDEGLQGLMQWIDDTLKLESIFLGNNQITAKGVKYIAEMLKTNTNLRALDLGFNQLGDDGATVLSASLKYHCAMQSIILEGNGIGDKGAAAVADALSDWACYPRGLYRLHIGGNTIGHRGAAHLAKAIALDPVLSYLDLGYNVIGNEGMKALCDAIRFNINLKTLDVEYNGLSGHDWHNTSNGGMMVLEVLKLRQNEVDIGSIIQFMNVCHSLRHIDIGHCNLRSDDISALASAVQNNFYIRRVVLDGNDVTDENAQLLVEAIIYRSCLSRPVEIISDYVNVNEIALHSSRSCSGGVLMDGMIRYKA